jgi:acyl-CoA thioesterase-2
MNASADGPLARLLGQLDLRPLDRDLFLAEPIPGTGRLFGGLVAAQSVVAAGRTVAEGALHSLHAYFLRPGAHEVPIRFVVDRIRDGRTFSTRRVIALQSGEAIFNLSASFAKPEEGIAHQESCMPEAPDPEELPDWEELRAKALGDASARRADGAVEIRACDPRDVDLREKLPGRKLIWLRPVGSLPEDPLVHAAVLVYASDRTLLSTAARPHALPWGKRRSASLDHAMWLHHVPRFDDWLLYASESPVAQSARGLILGAMYRRDGVRIASVAQEGLIRIVRGR